nr:signal peptidase I [Lachnospiraceae bacterium]
KDRNSLTFRRRERRKIKMSTIYEIAFWITGIVAAIFIGVTVVHLFGLRTSMVGSSMEPVLVNGQGVLLDRLSYQFKSPKRGDVVAFYPNGNKKSHLYIKRIIGLPGEEILIKDYYVYINGARYFMDKADYTYEGGVAENPVTLADNEYFVLGDNRGNSEDSRSANIGNIGKDMIVGRAWLGLKTSRVKTGLIE